MAKGNKLKRGTTIQLATSRFGEIEIPEDALLTFPNGLVGLQELKRFVMLQGAGPFQWLQSVDDPDATFVVIDSEQVVTDYNIHPTAEDLAVVADRLSNPLPLVALLLVTIPHEQPESMTANLMAPLLINTQTHRAVQAVLSDRYPVRHPFLVAVDQPTVATMA